MKNNVIFSNKPNLEILINTLEEILSTDEVKVTIKVKEVQNFKKGSQMVVKNNTDS